MNTELAADPIWEVECSNDYRPILEKICMSGLYRCSPRKVPHPTRIDYSCPYNQQYGQFLPYWSSHLGQVVMIDTYHLARGSCDTSICKELGLNRSSLSGFTNYKIWEFTHKIPYQNNDYMVNEAQFNYYYNASSPIINTTDVNCFELVCDLNDMRCAEQDEEDQFLREDIATGVMLFREHGYNQGGVTLIRKGTQPDLVCQIKKSLDTIVDNLHIPHTWDHWEWGYERLIKLQEELKRTGQELDPYLVVRMERILFKRQLLKQMEEKYNQEYKVFCDEHPYPQTDGE